MSCDVIYLIYVFFADTLPYDLDNLVSMRASFWCFGFHPWGTYARWLLSPYFFQSGTFAFGLGHASYRNQRNPHCLDFGIPPAGPGAQKQDQPQRSIDPFPVAHMGGKEEILHLSSLLPGSDLPRFCRRSWLTWSAQSQRYFPLPQERCKYPERVICISYNSVFVKSYLITCKCHFDVAVITINLSNQEFDWSHFVSPAGWCNITQIVSIKRKSTFLAIQIG